MTAPPGLLPQHEEMLKASGISPEVALARGYRSVTKKVDLEREGFARPQRIVPCLLIPLHDARGEVIGHQIRPDEPRRVRGKPLKYESPKGSRARLDIPPTCREQLGDPAVPLIITEGAKKADAAASRGLCAISVPGVWGWRGRNEQGGSTVLADWESVALKGRTLYLAFDSDAATNPQVYAAQSRLKGFLESRGATVRVIVFPAADNGKKVGLDDYLAAGHSVDDLLRLATSKLAPPPRPAQGSNGAEESPLPQIVTDNRQLRDIVQDGWAAMLTRDRGSVPTMFVRDGSAACLTKRADGPEISVVTHESMAARLARVADWFRETDEGLIPDWPPLRVARDMVEMPHPSLRPLKRIISMPVFNKDGLLLTEPGYYPDDGLILHEPLRVPPVPPVPTAADVCAARAKLDEIFADFPFETPADRCHAVAALISLVARELYPRTSPAILFDAPSPGSGKNLLFDSIMTVCMGREASANSFPTGEDEFRKLITSLLAKGPAAVLLDNAKQGRMIDSAVFAALLTTSSWSDRLLGVSHVVHLPNITHWFITGNNVRLSLELARRTLRIRLDPRVDRPWERTGFRHPQLKLWVLEHRAELLHAVLVLVQHWLAQGRPEPRAFLGSFESWSAVVGGIVEAAGYEGFLGDRNAMFEAADSESESWRSFVDAWWAAHGTGPQSVKVLRALCIEHDLLVDVVGSDSERSQSTKLGRALSTQRDRVYGNLRIELAKDQGHKGKHYRLVRIDSGDGGTLGDLGGTSEAQRSPSQVIDTADSYDGGGTLGDVSTASPRDCARASSIVNEVFGGEPRASASEDPGQGPPRSPAAVDGALTGTCDGERVEANVPLTFPTSPGDPQEVRPGERLPRLRPDFEDLDEGDVCCAATDTERGP